LIRLATYHDIPALKHIRKICFGESEAYSAFYFATRFTENNTLTYLEQDSPVASLTLLDAELLTADGHVFPVAYVYSVATLPNWRGRGIAAALSKYADDYLQARGVAASLLVPASAPLFDYYAKLGYETKFFVEKYEAACTDKESDTVLQASELEVGDYFRLRKEAYSGGGYYVQWSTDALDFALQDCRLTGGLAYRLHTAAREGFLLAYPMSDNTVIVKESWLDGDLYPLAVRLLQQKFGTHRKYIFYAMQRPETVTAQPFGMIKCYTGKALPLQGNIPYFGLAKD